MIQIAWYARRIGAEDFFECSAATGEGVEKLFECAAQEATARVASRKIMERRMAPPRKRLQ